MFLSKNRRFTVCAGTRCRPVAALLALGVFAAVSPPAVADDWPGFRGVNVDGISTERDVFPADGKFSLKIAWKVPLGSGYSSVAVAGGRVVTAFAAGDDDMLAAFSQKDGSELWRIKLDATYVGHDGSHTGPISTPLIAGDRVFALAPRGRLVAVGVADGKLLWESNLVNDFGAEKPHYGFTTSPLIENGVLIVALGSEEGSIGGFDPATGKQLWRAGKDSFGYQSPVPLTGGGGERLVVLAGDANLYGLEPKTGAVRWEYAHGGKGARGAGSLVPVPAGPNRLFISHKDESSAAVQLATDGGKTTVAQLWDDRSIHNSYNVPVYKDGHVYAYSSRFLTCVDAATGESVWRSRSPGDGFTMLVDGHLVISTKEGGLHVAEASPDGYHELAGVALFDDLAWSPASFADGSFYIRSLGELARVDVVTGPDAGAGGAMVHGGGHDTRFGHFLAKVHSASNKEAVVDGFLKTVKKYPFIDGKDRVVFLYRGPGTDLAVASDLFGARQEQAMKRVEGTDLFYHEMPLEPDARANYLFIRDYEEILDPNNARKTKTTIYGKEMEMAFSEDGMAMSWFAMPEWKAPTYLDTPDEALTGTVVSHEVPCAALDGKHKIDVYLPAGYEKSDRRYPVVYVHGGETAQTTGQWTRALDNLVGRGVAPLIAVFIHNVPRKAQQAYPAIVANDVIPFVDKAYRTKASADGRANYGAGFSGFTAMMCTFAKPGLVSKLATQSSFMFSSMTGPLKAAIKSAAEQPLDIYMEWGKYDLRNPHEAWDLSETNREFAKLLQDKGYAIKGGEVHDGTGWSSWHTRTDAVLKALFPNG